MDRLRAWLGLDKQTWRVAAAEVVTGGIGLLGANAFSPQPQASLLLWAFYWVVVAFSVGLTISGLLTAATRVALGGRLAWEFRRRLQFRNPIYVMPKPGEGPAEQTGLGGEVRPRGTANLTVVPGAPRKGLTVEEALDGWAHDRSRLRRAVDTAVTWLYRRQNWEGLSHDGRFSEPAPADIWASEKYKQLGLDPLPYEPPEQVPVEPGWTPPEVVPSPGVTADPLLKRAVGVEAAKVIDAADRASAALQSFEARLALDPIQESILLRVTNDGPAAEFSAEVLHIDGPHFKPAAERTDWPWKLMWRKTALQSQTIGPAASAALVLVVFDENGARQQLRGQGGGAFNFPGPSNHARRIFGRLGITRMEDLMADVLTVSVRVYRKDGDNQRHEDRKVCLSYRGPAKFCE